MADDLRQLRSLLRQAIAALRLGRREVETALGIGHGSLERVLDGSMELRVRHLLDLARLLQVPPKDFLEIACPEPPGGAKFRLRDWLGPREPAPAATPEKGNPTDLTAAIREGVLAEMARNAAPANPNLVEIIRAIVREELNAPRPTPKG
jgi:transcriptional regulator with XRE-family HTH domain